MMSEHVIEPRCISQSESDEYVKNWESYRFAKKSTLPASGKLGGPIQNSGSGSRGRFRTQGAPGTSGDEDEALETPQPEQRSQEQSSLEGQIKETTETPQKEWCDGGEKEVMNGSHPHGSE